MADDPLDLLAWTMLGEAANQGTDGMAAVAHVALNRAKSGKYAPDLASVLLQDKQFSAWNAGQGGNDPKGKYPKSSPEFQRAKAIAQQVIQGDIPDKTGGALNYHTTDVSPGWATRLAAETDPVTIGAHQFYPSANIMKASLPKAETPFSNGKGEQYAPAIVWNGRDANLTPEVVEVLNRTQELVDFPLVVNSGYRSPQRNAAANGAKGSQHLHGNAIDISLKGLTDAQRTQLTRALAQTGAKRLIAYSGNSALHFDMAKGFPPQKGFSAYAMFDKSSWNMGSAHPWFVAGLDGGKIPPRNIPQVATLTDTTPPAVTPASLSPQLAFTRQMTLPSYNVTPVLDRRSNKNIDNRKDVSVNSGINIPLQNAGIQPQPQMRPPAPGYKMAGKVQLSEDRFASGMADKTPPGATRVASLAPTVPMPRPRPALPSAPPSSVSAQQTFAGQDRMPQRPLPSAPAPRPTSPAPARRVSASDLARGQTPVGVMPGLVYPGNLDVNSRRVLPIPGGGVKTENSISIGTDRGETVIPTVVNGRQLSNDAAVDHFYRTGENLGSFRTPQQADIFAEALHNRQAAQYRQSPQLPGQFYAGQDRMPPRTVTRMVPNPAYAPPKTAAPGAGLSEAQMRAIRGDMSMIAPKPAAPAVPQFIPQTFTVPAPEYAPPKAPMPLPQPQQNGLLGNLMGALPKVDFGQIKDNVINAMGPAMLGSVAGRTALMKHVMRQNISPAPNAVPGLVSGGTPVHAVNNQGMTTATLMRPTGTGRGSEASRAFDEKVHAGQNMDVYRANRAATGGPISQKSIDNAIRSGKTLFKAS